jgi:hypothetical protein
MAALVAKRSPNEEPIESDPIANKSLHREDPMLPQRIA